MSHGQCVRVGSSVCMQVIILVLVLYDDDGETGRKTHPLVLHSFVTDPAIQYDVYSPIFNDRDVSL